MPLHRIYHPSSGPLAFTPSEKEALSRRITEIYTERAQLPAFYVVVLFIPIEEDSLFVGGEKNDKFVRIHIQHMARQFSNQDAVDGFFARYEEALEPFIKAKGLDWEVTIEEVERNLWRENGLPPPAPHSKAETEWRRLNKAVPYTEEDNKAATS